MLVQELIDKLHDQDPKDIVFIQGQTHYSTVAEVTKGLFNITEKDEMEGVAIRFEK